jgi:septal ring factor EnvC (AmiA/AmiB activator)
VFALANLTAEELAKIAASTELATSDKALAAEALAGQKELKATRHSKKQADDDLAAIEKELARLREDTKALGGERRAPPPAEFVKRILAAEDRHPAARKRIDALESEEKARAEKVKATLARLPRLPGLP